MVDESLIRTLQQAVDPQRCQFEKALLGQAAQCPRSTRLCVADRLSAGCCDAQARLRCAGLLSRVRAEARFALHLTHVDGRLPHAKEIKIQIGTLRGLARQMGAAGDHTPVADVDGLLRRAIAAYGALANIPLTQILGEVARSRGARR